MKIGSIVKLKPLFYRLDKSRVTISSTIVDHYGIGMIVDYAEHNSDRNWLVSWPKKSFRQWRTAESLEVIAEW